MKKPNQVTPKERVRPQKIWEEHAAKFPQKSAFKNEGAAAKVKLSPMNKQKTKAPAIPQQIPPEPGADGPPPIPGMP